MIGCAAIQYAVGSAIKAAGSMLHFESRRHLGPGVSGVGRPPIARPLGGEKPVVGTVVASVVAAKKEGIVSSPPGTRRRMQDPGISPVLALDDPRVRPKVPAAVEGDQELKVVP